METSVALDRSTLDLITPIVLYNRLQCFSPEPPLYRFHYDPEVKGWKVQQKESAYKLRQQTNTLTIFDPRKSNTILNIDVKALVRATDRKRRLVRSFPYGDMDLPETDNAGALSNPDKIFKPFIRHVERKQEAVWTTPISSRGQSERSKTFHWDKPRVTDSKELRVSLSIYQVDYLRKLLEEKEKDVKMLTTQLLKINAENVKLLKELEGYRGKNYDALYEENLHLRQQMARISKDNVVLEGIRRKTCNPKLNRLDR